MECPAKSSKKIQRKKIQGPGGILEIISGGFFGGIVGGFWGCNHIR